MQVGSSVPGPPHVQRWRFVENDLYGIVGRVQEYDRDARLIRDSATGQLGIARWHNRTGPMPPGWSVALPLSDPVNGGPLTTADQRVIDQMGRADSYGVNLKQYNERRRIAAKVADAKRTENAIEGEGDHAERFVHALRKDVNARPNTYVPEAVST